MAAKIAAAFFGVAVGLALSVVSDEAAADFKVNTFTTAAQSDPAAAALAGGGFAVAWESQGQDGSGLGLYAQRYGTNGQRAGVEFRVNTSTLGDQSEAAIAGLSGGGFIVVWTSKHLDSLGDIFARRYSAAGASEGGQFRINTVTTGRQSDPAVAALPNNAFIVVWTEEVSPTNRNIWGQRYRGPATKTGGPFLVNTFTDSNQTGAAVSRIGTGSAFLVAWASLSQDGEGQGVYAQRYADNGARAGIEFRVNASTAGSQRDASIARLNNGTFVIAFSSEKMQGDVLFQRYAANGSKLGGNVLANTHTALDQEAPSVAGIGTGGFAMTWQSQKQEGDAAGRGIYGQRYSVNGVKVGSEFHLNSFVTEDQEHPSVVPWSTKGFAAVWDSEVQDGSEEGVYGRLYQQ